MEFPESELTLKACRAHLEKTNTFNTEIESFLVQHLLIVICREYQTNIEVIFEKRARQTEDVEITNFVRSATNQLLRSIKISELKGFIGKFNDQHKERFGKFVESNGEAKAAYDNIVVNRHAVAHDGRVQLTFTELESSFKKSRGILEEMESIMGVSLSTPS
jgi:hypothetical protein